MKYLGLDLGTKTLGLAISDKTGTVASFYKNITFKDENILINEIVLIIDKEKIDCIILGLPKNMDNSFGPRAKTTNYFKNKLEQKINIPIIMEDERMSTKIAEHILIDADMSRKKRKKVIDGVSAVVILQSYLDRKEV